MIIDRAITLTQPWATLMATGHKRNETRGWPTHYRGWVAIHAAKGFPRECQLLCRQAPFTMALSDVGFKLGSALPIGVLVGVVEIVGCVRTEDVAGLTAKERALGDYSAGRYAFLTRGARQTKHPVPMKGALSIWRLPAPLTEADLL